jgi:hypothetical protein
LDSRRLIFTFTRGNLRVLFGVVLVLVLGPDELERRELGVDFVSDEGRPTDRLRLVGAGVPRAAARPTIKKIKFNQGTMGCCTREVSHDVTGKHLTYLSTSSSRFVVHLSLHHSPWSSTARVPRSFCCTVRTSAFFFITCIGKENY